MTGYPNVTGSFFSHRRADLNLALLRVPSASVRATNSG